MSLPATKPEEEKPTPMVLRFLYLVGGMSTSEIASVYGTTRQTVALWLKQHNIPLRPRGRPGKTEKKDV